MPPFAKLPPTHLRVCFGSKFKFVEQAEPYCCYNSPFDPRFQSRQNPVGLLGTLTPYLSKRKVVKEVDSYTGDLMLPIYIYIVIFVVIISLSPQPVINMVFCSACHFSLATNNGLSLCFSSPLLLSLDWPSVAGLGKLVRVHIDK